MRDMQRRWWLAVCVCTTACGPVAGTGDEDIGSSTDLNRRDLVLDDDRNLDDRRLVE
jgi:hypothetical protein